MTLRLHSLSCKIVCTCLTLLITLSGCASHVVISQPYHEKLRVGDGVKLLSKDGTVHAGRIVYLDRASVVIRTPKQIKTQRPVEMAQFGTTVPWSEVVGIKVAGTLDSQRTLISSEEIRVNQRTNHRRNFAVNIGLLGLGASFLTGVYIQDRISPATSLTAPHNQGRLAFWAAFAGGSLASAFLGYKIGDYRDRHIAITRIERQRTLLREAAGFAADSLRTPSQIFPPAMSFPSPQ